MKQLFLICLSIYLLSSCSEKKETEKFIELPTSTLSGSELASMHCARCHAFVKPELLPKLIWKENVLPAMGFRMGIFKDDDQRDSLFNSIEDTIVSAANVYPKSPVLAKVDWDKIVDFYIKNAPDTIIPPKRDKNINMGLKHFKFRQPIHSDAYPLTSMVKILPDNRGIVFSDGNRNRNSLTFLDINLERDYSLNLPGIPIHYYEKSDTLYLTTIGEYVTPYDGFEGALLKVYRKAPEQNYNVANSLIPNLQRPVFMEYGDLNNDGLEDIVACEYGNLLGKLVWYENMGSGTYSAHVLKSQPGAIKAIIKDVNNDGFKDIVVLMAQGDEGVFFFENKRDGTFKEKRLLTFLPLNGSQYIELADFNNDGFDDIIYVCGDNADKTPILKKYHGIYIYLNDGKFNFNQSYFYPLNGAYKAMPRDYDLDGDLDIAAISFFPDYANYPEESFVYLENKGNLEFEDYSFPESINGRWIVMDAEDMDADGDIDIVLGSFVYFKAKGDTTGLGEKWMNSGPSIVVLENTIR